MQLTTLLAASAFDQGRFAFWIQTAPSHASFSSVRRIEDCEFIAMRSRCGALLDAGTTQPIRAVLRLPVNVQVPVAGSYNSALAKLPLPKSPPATSTLPLASNVEV